MNQTVAATCPWCGRDIAYVTLSTTEPATVEKVEAYCYHRKCRRQVTGRRMTPVTV